MKLIKNRIVKLTGLAVLCTSFSACDQDFDDPIRDEDYHSGTADFSQFVSLGDSLTAGYADNALYKSGQENSFPNILAQQFSRVGGGDFVQPLMNDNLGGLLFNGVEHPGFPNRLVLDGESPTPIEGTPTTEVFFSGLTGFFNNMGVPGAKSFHFSFPGYGDANGLQTDPATATATANPYFVRFASSNTASMVSDAAAQQPSFFTLWVGNNDILSYATTGGTGEDQTGSLINPYNYGTGDITAPSEFTSAYTELVDAMTSAGGKGVLINLPDISTIPFFTTVPYNAIPLDQETVDTLNAAFVNDYNEGLQGAVLATLITEEEATQRTLAFSAGQNAVLITDEDLTDLSGLSLPSMRQATANDLLLLPTSSKLGKPIDENSPTFIWGVSVPLTDTDVLIPSEITAIETARTAYNTAIKSVADANENLLHLDVAALLDDLQDGIDYGTGYVDATFGTGGAFSLDGVHLTARGYAIVANEIMDTIETGFGAHLPAVDPGAYTTIFVK